MPRDNFDDFELFDQQFNKTRRSIGRGMAVVLLIQAIWAVGCIGILGGLLWFVGRLAQVW